MHSASKQFQEIRCVPGLKTWILYIKPHLYAAHLTTRKSLTKHGKRMGVVSMAPKEGYQIAKVLKLQKISNFNAAYNSIANTVEPLYNGHFGTRYEFLAIFAEVFLFQRLKMHW